MLMKTGLFLLLLAVLQVSARYTDFKGDGFELNSDERIVSGWEAELGQLPYHASLRMVSPTGTVGRCGGAVVTRRWILTAAFCTAGRVTIVVRVGTLSLNDSNPENMFETTEWYNFPTFDNSKPTRVQPNDISLVRLRRAIEYSDLVQPIRVQSNIDAYRDYSGEQVIVSGHGWTSNAGAIGDVLRWVKLRAISNYDCARSYPHGTILNTIVCAEYFNVTSQSACRGDFGGPLVHADADGIPTLIGIFVFTTSEDDSCPSGMPTGYTRPGPYLPWFRQITDIDFENPRDEDDEEDSSTTGPESSPPEISSTSVPEVSSTPSTDVTSTATPDVISTPAPEVTSTAAPEVTSTAAPDVTFTPSPEVTSTAAPEVTSTATPEVTSTAGPEVTSTAAPDVTFTPAPEVTSIATPELTSTAAPELTSTATPDVTSTTAPELTSTTAPEVTSTASPELTSIATPELTSTAAPDVTSTTAPEVTSTAAPEVTSTTTPELTSTSAPEVTSTTAPELTSTSAPDVTYTVAPDVTSTVAPDVTFTPSPEVTSTSAPAVTSTAVPDVTSTSAPDVTSTIVPDTTSTASPDVTSTAAPVVTSTTVPYTTSTAIPDLTTGTPDHTVGPSTTPEIPFSTTEGSGDGDDSDSSESDQDNDIAQLLKRLQVFVKVKVRMDKFNTTKAVGMAVDQYNH